eukprot:1160181-Pelagomonas_calceolata.AAC.6
MQSKAKSLSMKISKLQEHGKTGCTVHTCWSHQLQTSVFRSSLNDGYSLVLATHKAVSTHIIARSCRTRLLAHSQQGRSAQFLLFTLNEAESAALTSLLTGDKSTLLHPHSLIPDADQGRLLVLVRRRDSEVNDVKAVAKLRELL